MSGIDRMVMIVYNEVMDEEIMEMLGRCDVKNYTKIVGAFGKGASSGTHMGDDVWPGKNNILHVACAREEAGKILSMVGVLRDRLGKEGVKAFLMPVEDVT
jgi:hypothetical protein